MYGHREETLFVNLLGNPFQGAVCVPLKKNNKKKIKLIRRENNIMDIF